MSSYNCLTEKDKELIEDYISWFGPSNPDNMDWDNYAGLETVLHEWDKSKDTLLKLFGGKNLILHRPYTYKYNVEGLSREIAVAMEEKPFKAFTKWWNWSIKHNGAVKFDVVQNDERFSFYSKFHNIESDFDCMVLAENAYNGPDYKVIFEDGTVFKVTSGMKPMKILHKFIEKFGTPEDEEMFDRFRIWHSQLLNQKAVDGDLCLSIHPLDYMTMSDNNNKWSSCMRWTDKCGNAGDPGDYRAGTIDCMNSPYIVIAYLHNPKHPFELKNGWTWNSKRWRELFIINDGSITEIKGYPYQDENLTNTCLMWLKELAYNNLGWTYDDEEVNMKNPIPIENGKSLYIDYIKPTYMYKDIGSLDKHAGRINKEVLITRYRYNPSYIRHTEDQNLIFINIPYGGTATCMCCGRERDDEEGDRNVMCPACEHMVTCSCCGEALFSDDEIYWVEDNDGPLCYNCYCDETIMDELTEEPHMSNNMTEVWLLLGYDKDKEPVWYRDKTVWVYDPDNNWEYQRMFTEAPKCYNSYMSGYREYVTTDMICDHKWADVMEVFGISDWEDVMYPYNLYYLTDMSLAYPEEEDNDE